MNFALHDVPLPFRLRTEVPMTDDELIRFCAMNEALRVEREPNGELLVMTPAGSKSGRRNFEIIGELHAWAQRDGRGYGFDSNTGFTLPDSSMRSPDAAWLSSEKFDVFSEADKERYAPVCPEFVIELRSASDRLPDVEAKMEQWIGNGAQVAWLIDPQEKTVTIYRTGQQAERLEAPGVVSGDGPIAGFELVMERIWK